MASEATSPAPEVTPAPGLGGNPPAAEPSNLLPVPPSLPQTTTLAEPGSLSTPSAEPNNPGNTSADRGSENGLGSGVPSDSDRAGLDPTVERILISVGSIGKRTPSLYPNALFH